ncbi:MAG: response regulator [Acidobacteriota bacterium]
MNEPLYALIAEGDTVTRRALQRLLERSGYRVRLAVDGDEALRELRREPPALAMVGLHSLGRGGLDLLARARREHAPETTQWVLVSDAWHLADWERARTLGARALITRRFSPSELLALIHDWTRNLGEGASASEAARAPDPIPNMEEPQ